MISACPTCGSPGIPLIFGLPIPEARLAAQNGELALAGCLRPDAPPDWQCPQDHRWQDGPESEVQEQILSILKVYGYDGNE
jgi:hypothetical protein